MAIFLLLFLAFQPASNYSVEGSLIRRLDHHVLQAFKQDLIDPGGVLRKWNDTDNDACSGKWIGIQCVRGKVVSIRLPGKGLKGRITEKIGQLRSLKNLNLHDNFIEGSIPSSLGFLSNLRGIYLFNNRLSGSIPPSIGHCLKLLSLDLSNNYLTGSIPSTFSNSSNLYRVNLSFNKLSGPVPLCFTQAQSLTFLSLQNNNISGPIPNTWENTRSLKTLILDHNIISGSIPTTISKLDQIEEISFSNNHLSGSIPEELGKLPRIKVIDFSHNSIGGSIPARLCNLSSLIQLKINENGLENRIPQTINQLRSLSVLSLKGNRLSGEIPPSLGDLGNLTFLDLSENAFSGEIPSKLALVPDLNLFNVSYNNLSGNVPPSLAKKFASSSFMANLQLCGYNASFPCPSSSKSNPPPAAIPLKSKTLNAKYILFFLGALLIFLLLLCCVVLCFFIRKKVALSNGKLNPVTGKIEKESGSMKIETEITGGKLILFDGLMTFTAEDLLCATAEIIGKSHYGTVYKATMEDGNGTFAVKRLKEKVTRNQKEFEIEVNMIGRIRHPNLLPLRAFYLGPQGEKLLIFDFMEKGNLSSFLHGHEREIPIDWNTRMNIILAVTRGLCYLHNQENIIHGNLNSPNILLDEINTAKISDFGILRLVMTSCSISKSVVNSGYRAPELKKLRKVSKKSDIYSLGIIILEILTGKSPNESLNGAELPQWVASIVKEDWANEVFDSELMKDDELLNRDELFNTLNLGLQCVDPSPMARPDIEKVLEQLEKIQLGSEEGTFHLLTEMKNEDNK